MDEIRNSGRPPAVSEPAHAFATFVAFCVVVAAGVFVNRIQLTTTGNSPTATTQASTVSEPDTVHIVSSIPVPPPDPAIVEEVVGHSVLGQPIPLIRIGTGPAILIMASIHGNESAGTHLVERFRELLLKKLSDFPRDRSVILMPVLNPDGVEAKTRGNAHGVDLNRNFPAENRENSQRYGLTALSEPEALAIYKTIERFQPIRIVTLHEPLHCVDYDGPGLELATAMAEVCPLAVKKLGTRPGSMGAFTGEARHIPTITLELPRDARGLTADELWERYGAAMLTAVTHPLESTADSDQ